MTTVIWAAATVVVVIYAIHLLWPLLLVLSVLALLVRHYSGRGRHHARRRY